MTEKSCKVCEMQYFFNHIDYIRNFEWQRRKYNEKDIFPQRILD